MTTDVSPPRAAGRACPGSTPDERRTNFNAGRAGSVRRRARGAAPSCVSTVTVRPTARATCSATASSTRSSRTGSTAAGRSRLPGRLPPRLHHARAQPLHQLPALRARLPPGGGGELLRRHGPRLGHHRLDARQPAVADGRLRFVRQVRRDLPDGLHRDQSRASCRATTSTRAAASSAASASRSAPTTPSSRPTSSSSPPYSRIQLCQRVAVRTRRPSPSTRCVRPSPISCRTCAPRSPARAGSGRRSKATVVRGARRGGRL